MSGTYRFDFNQGEHTVEGMDRSNQKIRSGLDQLQAHCRSSLAEWQYQAREEYNRVEAEWNNSAQQMTVALNQARAALSEIGNDYGVTENKNTGMWQQTKAPF